MITYFKTTLYLFQLNYMLLSILLSTLISAAHSDTLVVENAQMEGPYSIMMPYSTDSLNMKGEKNNVSQEILSQNTRLVDNFQRGKATSSTVSKGQSIALGADSLSAIHLMHFNVQTSRFTQAEVLINKLANYKLFVNGTECADKKVKLVPGRTDFVLQALTQKGDDNRFDVKIVGDDLSHVQINAQGKRPFTIGQQTWGDHYYHVALSPTGKYLVVVSYNTSSKDGKKQYTTLLTETTSGRELLRWKEYVNLRWLASNEDVLYYTRTGAKGRELVEYNPSTAKENILACQLPEGDFSISPKKDYLIFSKTEEGKPSKDGLKKIGEPDDRMPGWRNRTSLWRFDLKTQFMQRLTFGKESVSLADISNDGHSLLLQYARCNVEKLPMYRTTFVRMDAYTGKVDTLLADTTFIASAKFSSNAQHLLISATPAAFDGIGSEVKAGQTPQGFDYRLFLYDIASKGVTPLLRNFNPTVADYEWNRGDGMIYFTADDRLGRGLFQLNPKTQKVTHYELPLTYVQDYTISSAQKSIPKVVFFGQSPSRARDMYTCELRKAKVDAQRIGNIHFEEIYQDVAIAPSQEWQFKASRGDSIDGFFLLPPDFDQSKKYPMIVYYYGGCVPSSNLLESWYPFQTFASQGYVVYVINPSGATAYGQEFAARHVNAWGKDTGDDIIEGVKTFCKVHSFVDVQRIGCIGASYGGFMTEYLQTRTNLFAAAISHAGISNITSYWGGGYWGYSYGETAQYGSFPWNNPELYIKQSPLFSADKIHTPLLLLHGTVDTNVPTNESQQLYNALRILGREVAYVQVEGENHVVVDYNKRLAWLNVIYAWFAKYLQKDDSWWKALDL